MLKCRDMASNMNPKMRNLAASLSLTKLCPKPLEVFFLREFLYLVVVATFICPPVPLMLPPKRYCRRSTVHSGDETIYQANM